MSNGVRRVEMGSLGPNGISPSQWGFRASDGSGKPIFDSLGLIAAASLLGNENLGSVPMSGSGSGFGTVQTITGSGINFTMPRQGNILVISKVSVIMTAGATNYCALYHGLWTQGGSLVSRQSAGLIEPAQNVTHTQTLVSTFMSISAGSYQLRQEFALDAGTTSVGFGTSGIAPQASVIQLGG